jgi:hypothetical protein
MLPHSTMQMKARSRARSSNAVVMQFMHS